MGGVRGGVLGGIAGGLFPHFNPPHPSHLLDITTTSQWHLYLLWPISYHRYCWIYISVFRFQIWNKQQNLLLLPGLLRSSLAEAHHPYDCCNARLHINLKRKFFIPVKCRISSSWRLFRSLNFKFPILWALKPCDPRNSYGTVCYPGNSMIARE